MSRKDIANLYARFKQYPHKFRQPLKDMLDYALEQKVIKPTEYIKMYEDAIWRK